jgi:hypothetical protein
MRAQAAAAKFGTIELSCGVLSIRPTVCTMPAPSLAGNDRGAAGSAGPLSPESPMIARQPIPGWAPHAVLVATLLLPLLSACGPARNQFAPACPRPSFLADAADLDIYRPGVAPGGAHDITDLVLHARIIGVSGNCRPGDNKDQLATTVTVGVELTRGPSMQGRDIDVPVFVAVTEGETILDKRVYQVHATFPSNVDRMTFTTGEIAMTLPISSTKSGAAYSILTGFQLSPDQIIQNRRSHAP